MCKCDCIYFPDMMVKEWKWSEDGTYKVREEKKVFCCLYDGKPIDWERRCPRNDIRES